jgi:hypothetical protein
MWKWLSAKLRVKRVSEMWVSRSAAKSEWRGLHCTATNHRRARWGKWKKLLLVRQITTYCSKQRVVILLLLRLLLSLQHHQATTAYIIVVKHQLIGTIRKWVGHIGGCHRRRTLLRMWGYTLHRLHSAPLIVSKYVGGLTTKRSNWVELILNILAWGLLNMLLMHLLLLRLVLLHPHGV